MSKINCCVKNCSHNKDGMCYSNFVAIVGESAKSECDTCCSSFLDKKHYSDLTDNTQSYGSCESLICKVETCTYNDNCICQLDSIVVNGEQPKLYSETNCASYEKE